MPTVDYKRRVRAHKATGQKFRDLRDLRFFLYWKDGVMWDRDRGFWDCPKPSQYPWLMAEPDYAKHDPDNQL